MRSPTFRTLILFLSLFAPVQTSLCQGVVLVNAVETGIHLGYTADISEEESSQVAAQTGTTAMQSAIAAQFAKIHEWEANHNSYLKTASGFAELLKASSHIYSQSVRIFMHLIDTGKAVSDNPEGVFASMSMYNLYIDVAAELISVHTLLKEAVTGEGENHMLSGEERLTLVWELDDRLTSLDDKIHKLSLSIRLFTLVDIWDDATAGIINKDNGMIAERALDRWKRTINLVEIE